jgi:hypothetical protein
MKRDKTIAAALVFGFLLVSCGVLSWQNQNTGTNETSGAASSGLANGERIYFTSIDGQGNPITYTGGPNFGGMMMGSYLTCASCHGPEGRGGLHVMHMGVMDAPAINYDGLVEMKIEDSGGTPQPGGYSLEDFQKAVVDGEDIDGEALKQDMPRWQMNDQDLADLFAFLKSIN